MASVIVLTSGLDERLQYDLIFSLTRLREDCHFIVDAETRTEQTHR